MKFKHVLLALATSAVMFACGGEKKTESAVDSTGAEITYTIDTASSKVAWKGSMLKMHSHNGLISLNEGTLTVKGNLITAGSFTINMKSITPLDSNYNKEHPKEYLIGHLSGADFFAVDTFPTASFVVKKVEGNTITGDLTLRGKTNEEKVTDVVVTADSANVNATGKLTFNRQKYGVAYKAANDMVLSDDIELDITLVGKK
jgi:polyisoprenoid-binding protein YceI